MSVSIWLTKPSMVLPMRGAKPLRTGRSPVTVSLPKVTLPSPLATMSARLVISPWLPPKYVEYTSAPASE